MRERLQVKKHIVVASKFLLAFRLRRAAVNFEKQQEFSATFPDEKIHRAFLIRATE